MGALATAVVMARAGSKGLPGKNTALVGGRPCVAWTIEAARRARTVEGVIVSSDDADVVAIGRQMGARVVARREEDATDTAPVVRALWHAIEDADDSCALVVMLYGNVPVRPRGLIDRAVEMLVRSGADSVQSYVRVGKHHPMWQARVDGETGRVRAWEGDVLFGGVDRRQDLPPAFVPDGGVVAMTRRALERGAREGAGAHDFLGEDHRGIVTEPGEVVDIDSRIDLLVGDAILREGAAGAA